MSETFTLEEYQNTKFKEFWLTDEQCAQIDALAEPLRQFCIANSIPMVVMFGTGNNQEAARVSSAANFMPLERLQPELMLAYYLANNGPGEEFTDLYMYLNHIHASKFPVQKSDDQ